MIVFFSFLLLHPPSFCHPPCPSQLHKATANIIEPTGESDNPLRFTSGLVVALDIDATLEHVQDPQGTVKVQVSSHLPETQMGLCLTGSLFHRIIEWFGLEGTLKIIWFQPPCHEQGHLPPDQAAQSSIQPGLEHCQGGGSHSFSGQPGPVFHHPHGEEFLPNI